MKVRRAIIVAQLQGSQVTVDGFFVGEDFACAISRPGQIAYCLILDSRLLKVGAEHASEIVRQFGKEILEDLARALVKSFPLRNQKRVIGDFLHQGLAEAELIV